MFFNNASSTATASCLCSRNRPLSPINDFDCAWLIFAHLELSLPQNDESVNTITNTSANKYRRFMLVFLLSNQRKNVGTRNINPLPFKHGTTTVFIPRCCLFLNFIVVPLSTSALFDEVFESSISFVVFTRSRILARLFIILVVLLLVLLRRRRLVK